MSGRTDTVLAQLRDAIFHFSYNINITIARSFPNRNQCLLCNCSPQPNPYQNKIVFLPNTEDSSCKTIHYDYINSQSGYFRTILNLHLVRYLKTKLDSECKSNSVASMVSKIVRGKYNLSHQQLYTQDSTINPRQVFE